MNNLMCLSAAPAAAAATSTQKAQTLCALSRTTKEFSINLTLALNGRHQGRLARYKGATTKKNAQNETSQNPNMPNVPPPPACLRGVRRMYSTNN